MPLFPITKEEIFMRHIERLNSSTNITQNTPGGKARFFLDAISTEQSRQYDFFNENIVQAYLQYSSGKFLDFWGDLFQIPRLESLNAESTDDNFMFYVDSGTFGDINNNGSFVIPAGTTISIPAFSGSVVTPNITSTNTVSYSTIAAVRCNPQESFIFVKVRASKEGRQGNVPKGVLLKHNFVSYSAAGKNSLKCLNRFSIDNGDERETDGAYRYRLMQGFRGRHKAVAAAIRLAALSVPGVANILSVPSEQGPGTLTIYVKGTTPTTSPQLLAKVASSVQSVIGEGVRLFTFGPRPIGIELFVGVNWSPKATEQQKLQEKSLIKETAQSYMNTLDLGQPLDLNTLFFTMLRAAPSALSFGKATPNKFEEVYVYRSIVNGVGYIRSRFTGEIIAPLYNERVILETSGQNGGVTII